VKKLPSRNTPAYFEATLVMKKKRFNKASIFLNAFSSSPIKGARAFVSFSSLV